MSIRVDTLRALLNTSGHFALVDDEEYIVSKVGDDEYLIFSELPKAGFVQDEDGDEEGEVYFVKSVNKGQIQYGYSYIPVAKYGTIDCSVVLFNAENDIVILRSEMALDASSEEERDSFVTKVLLRDHKLQLRLERTRAFDLKTEDEYRRELVESIAPTLVESSRLVDMIQRKLENETRQILATISTGREAVKPKVSKTIVTTLKDVSDRMDEIDGFDKLA